MSKSGTTVEFKYDHNGMRTQKKVTAGSAVATTNYYLHGKLVTHMTVGSDTLHFFYDAQSRPAKVSYNGVIYTYIHNLQGDVVGLLDSTGNLVVEYKYDAWGRLLSTTGSLADTLGKRNPLRYRGYIYDEETGLYWLKSRYYNPELLRFINMDSISRGATLLSINLYAYCRSNPTTRYDPDGRIDREAIREYASKFAKKAWTFGQYWGGRNRNYYNYRADCANFVSQCLFAGGLRMNDHWYSKKTTKDVCTLIEETTFNVSEVWCLANKQYKYFSNPDNGYINGDVLKFKSPEIAYYANNGGIQAGDLLYFAGENGDNPHHATIVTKVEGGDIFYAGHTNERFDYSLTSANSNEYFFVIRLFDDAE